MGGLSTRRSLGGVNWDTQDVPLEDIDRIEVIRGPGATIWGANAVNGVINIVTKRAADTQGGLVTAGGGTEGQALGTVQYGGTLARKHELPHLHKVPQSQFVAGTGRHKRRMTTGTCCTAASARTRTFPRKIRSPCREISIPARKAPRSFISSRSIRRLSVIWTSALSAFPAVIFLAGGTISFSNRSDTTFQFYFDNYDRTGPEAERNP